MPTPTRKTPQRIKRMLAMHRAGASTREIGEELDISHVSIARWLKDAGLDANGGHGERTTRKRRPLAPAAEVLASVGDEVIGADMPSDRAGAVAHVQRRLKQVSDSADSQLHNEGWNPAQLNATIKLENELLGRIAEFSPREPPDPEKDVANVQAAESVRQKIAVLVDAARREARCVHCGKNPHA